MRRWTGLIRPYRQAPARGKWSGASRGSDSALGAIHGLATVVARAVGDKGIRKENTHVCFFNHLPMRTGAKAGESPSLFSRLQEKLIPWLIGSNSSSILYTLLRWTISSHFHSKRTSRPTRLGASDHRALCSLRVCHNRDRRARSPMDERSLGEGPRLAPGLPRRSDAGRVPRRGSERPIWFRWMNPLLID